MVFKTSEDKAEDWLNKDREFHKWFAWYPVRLDYYSPESGYIEDNTVWLQFVERRRCVSSRRSYGQILVHDVKTHQYRLIKRGEG